MRVFPLKYPGARIMAGVQRFFWKWNNYHCKILVWKESNRGPRQKTRRGEGGTGLPPPPLPPPHPRAVGQNTAYGAESSEMCAKCSPSFYACENPCEQICLAASPKGWLVVSHAGHFHVLLSFLNWLSLFIILCTPPCTLILHRSLVLKYLIIHFNVVNSLLFFFQSCRLLNILLVNYRKYKYFNHANSLNSKMHDLLLYGTFRHHSVLLHNYLYVPIPPTQ